MFVALQETAPPAFAAWESFYVIVGSSSAALTGLMFVVVSLMPGAKMGGSEETMGAFATPNVVHFCGVFLVSAVLSAPWPSVAPAALVLGMAGGVGVAYVFIVSLRTFRQTDYKPVFEDILWHNVLPAIGYIGIVVAAVYVDLHPHALFAIAAGTLLLLFSGIHNAWDSVVYIATAQMRRERKEEHRALRPDESFEL